MLLLRNRSHVSPLLAIRNFSVSAQLLKKKASSAGAAASSPTDAEGIGFDASAMKQACENMLKQFEEKVKEAKSSAVSTEKFSSLAVDLGQGTISPLKSLATIAARGNKINIVAYDPKQLKRIQTAIVSQLGMSAEPSGADKQTISVTIPQQSEAKKTASAKLIKDAFEALRNNSGNKHSLASIRTKYIAPLKKAASKSSGVSKDDVKKQTQEIEQIVKNYTNKLSDLFKKSS